VHTKKRSQKHRSPAKIDWSVFDATTEAQIVAQLARDPDTAPNVTSLGPGRIVHPPKDVDVRAIRRKLRLSQARFARRYGFSLGSVRNWEQGRRRPEGPARILLKVIDTDPKFVDRALSGII
jgi:putative transcriptional regulator